MGNISENDYLVFDLEPNRVTQFNPPVVGRSLTVGTRCFSVLEAASAQRGVDLTTHWPQVFTLLGHLCALASYRFSTLSLLILSSSLPLVVFVLSAYLHVSWL